MSVKCDCGCEFEPVIEYRHKLLCGDSTKREDVERVMGGEKADMVFIDPPYGVSYIGNANGKKWDALKNDELRGGNLQEFLTQAFTNIYEYTADNISLYCWHASRTQREFETALNDSGFEVKQQLIWNKGMGFDYCDYHSAHEPLLYCKKKGQKTAWYGNRKNITILGQRRADLELLSMDSLINIITNIMDESTVWEVDKDNVNNYLHPTQKPIKLAINAIKNSSKNGQLVIDYFAGSGSTMVSCENIGRRCYSIEYSNKYCSVALQRMQDAFPDIEIRRL